MTGYREIVVSGPTEAFDRLREKFYVKDDTGDELVLLYEHEGSPIDDPVRNLIHEEFGLDNYRAGGSPVRHQKDLPEELQDERALEAEQERGKPEGTPISESEGKSIVRVLEAIKRNESDHDHVSALDRAIERVHELAEDDLSGATDSSVDDADVEAAVDVLEREGVEFTLNQGHPNNVLYSALGFVEAYRDGDMPLALE